MKLEWLIVVLFFLVGFLYYDRFFNSRSSGPKLAPGERLAKIPEGHSNITVARKGDRVVFNDEEQNEFNFKETVK